MKSIRIICIGLSLALLIPVTAVAKYTIYGVGSASCGEWVTDRKNGDWYSKGQWMLGVISAVGYYDVYDLKETDSQAFAVWLDNYCQANPLNQINEGVYDLVRELAIPNGPNK
mgnify:CR=1 FL=1